MNDQSAQVPVLNTAQTTKLITAGFVVSAILELVLFFSIFTDYSWNNFFANLFFPLLVGGIGLVVFITKRLSSKLRHFSWLVGLCYWPGIIYSLLYLIVLIIGLIPPFLLATLFTISEELGRSEVQRSTSPDGIKTGIVSFMPVGPYTSGSGYVDIQLTYKYLPFIKRDFLYLGKTNRPEHRINGIEWLDNNSIYVEDLNESFKIGLVQFHIPGLIQLLLSIIAIPFIFIVLAVNGLIRARRGAT